MKKYLDKILPNLPEDMTGTALLPTAEHLFKTWDNAPVFNDKQATLFHHIMAQRCLHANVDDQTSRLMYHSWA